MYYLILDAAVVLIMLVVVINATRRGFISAVFKFLTTVASLGIAVSFYRTLGAFLDENFVRAWLEARQVHLQEPLALPDVTKIFGENEFLSGIATRFGVDLRGALLGDLLASGSSAAEEATGALSQVISNIIAFILIFIVSILVLKLASLLLSAVFKLPVLRSVNRALGFLLGLCEALLIAVVLSSACVGIFESYGMIRPDFPLADVGNNTYIIRFFAGLFKTPGAV